MKIISLILFILLIGCVPKANMEDEKFRVWFFNKMEVIDKHFESKIYDDEFMDASIELYVITEIKMNLEVKMYSDLLGWSDSLIYKQRDYKRDKKKFIRWYNRNKYKMNITKVDSILRAQVASYPQSGTK